MIFSTSKIKNSFFLANFINNFTINPFFMFFLYYVYVFLVINNEFVKEYHLIAEKTVASIHVFNKIPPDNLNVSSKWAKKRPPGGWG